MFGTSSFPVTKKPMPNLREPLQMKACKPFSTKATSFHLGAEMVQVGYCRRVWRRTSFSTCTAGALRRLKLRSLANARTDFPISLLFTYLSLFRANWTPVKSSGSNREKPASILGFSTVAVLFEGLNHFYPCILPLLLGRAVRIRTGVSTTIFVCGSRRAI